MLRVPFWAQALALCALFAGVGVAVVDDYGATWDEFVQRRLARDNIGYIATGDISALAQDPDIALRYYGLAAEAPLFLAERALGLQDTRHIYLMRHMVTHLLFIAGGFACGMLAYRTLGSRWVALFAMLLFLLHPRLYAHSFFNSKDIPFAATLIIALYLAHRAFRKDTIGAFLLCGIVVGLAINMRPFGLMLLPMTLAMRAPDLWRAGGEERKRILASAGIFVAAALATAWIFHPYSWENPLRFIEGVRAVSQHPAFAENLFMGEIHRSYAVPWNYVPVWFAITAPPVALPLGAIGCAAVCWQAITRPMRALRDREILFRALLLGCFAMPVAVVIILQSNIYNDWRQMYFLWGPFCLLAAVGLRALASGGGAKEAAGGVAARLPGWVRGGALRRTLAYGVVGVGLATTLTAMAALHPHQQVYFSALVDTKTPGALGKRYETDYWHLALRQSMEYLLARYPDDVLRVWPPKESWVILPQNDRERFVNLRQPHAADFYLWTALDGKRYVPLYAPNPRMVGFYHPRIDPRRIPDQRPIHTVKAYGSVIALIFAKDTDAYLAAYDDVAANGDPLARADFDIYAYDDALYYLSANCAPPMSNDAGFRAFLHFFPVNRADLPPDSREHGFENRDFWFNEHAAFFDGKCANRHLLPDYPIARIATGEHVGGEVIWRADIDMVAYAAAQALYESIAAGDYGAPVAQSDFDVYLRGNGLAYLKEPCAPGDSDARFFLHITPADAADLPADRRERGFVNMDFRFADYGMDIGGKCVAERELPDYAIERIRTGQNAAARGGAEWRVDMNMSAHAAAQALYDGIAAGDYGQPVAQSDFDVYLRGNGLAYLKEPCALGDADARFFLHIIPADPADLPADRRERGFANMDFRFADHGAYAGDVCVATLELPDYEIERVRTGQFVSGEGAVWRVEFAAGQ